MIRYYSMDENIHIHRCRERIFWDSVKGVQSSQGIEVVYGQNRGYTEVGVATGPDFIKLCKQPSRFVNTGYR